MCNKYVAARMCFALFLGEVMQEVEDTGEIEQKDSQEDASLPSLAHFICTNGGSTEKAIIAAQRTDPEWVLDSGASQHVAGDFREFESHDLVTHTPSQSNTLCTSDRTLQPIKGIRTVTMYTCY